MAVLVDYLPVCLFKIQVSISLHMTDKESKNKKILLPVVFFTTDCKVRLFIHGNNILPEKVPHFSCMV